MTNRPNKQTKKDYDIIMEAFFTSTNRSCVFLSSITGFSKSKISLAIDDYFNYLTMNKPKKSEDSELYYDWCIGEGISIYPQATIKGYRIIIDTLVEGVHVKKYANNALYEVKPNENDPKWWEEINSLYKNYYEKRAIK